MTATSLVRRLALTCLCGLLLALAPARAAPPAVAVLYFDNQGNPELEPLKVGLAQMLITDLQAAAAPDGAAPAFTVVERSQLQAILDELELGHEGVVDPATAGKLGKLLGARWLVLGSYFELVGSLRIDARLVRVETGEIVSATGADGGRAEFMAMEDELAAGLSRALASQAAAAESTAPPSPDPAPADTRASAGQQSAGGSGEIYVSGSVGPSPAASPAGSSAAAATQLVAPDADSLAAAVAFSEGLILLDRHEPQRAREAFETAIARDPALDAARAQLAGMDL